MSGMLYAFVTRTKFPKSRFVTPALMVSTSLAFRKSLRLTPKDSMVLTAIPSPSLSRPKRKCTTPI